MSADKNKIISLLLSTTMTLTALTACSTDGNTKVNEPSDNASHETETIQSTPAESEESVESEPVTSEPSETTAPSSPEINVDDILQLRIKGTYLSVTDGISYTGGIVCDTLELRDDFALAYPELANALNESAENSKTSLVTAIRESNESGIERYIISHVAIRRASEGILSYVRTNNDLYSNNTEYLCETYDIATGARLTSDDIFTDMNEIAALLNNQQASVTSLTDLNEWTIDAEGVTFFIRQNEYFIPFVGNESLFADSIRPIAEDYVVKLTSDEYYVDLDSDGSLERISFADVAADFYEISGLTIGLDDITFTFENFFAFSRDEYLIRHDGEYFLYVITTTESDYQELHVYRLESGAVINEDNMGGSIGNWQLPDDEYNDYESGGGDTYYEGILTNPEDFYFGTRNHTISTNTAYMHVSMNSMGLPETIDPEEPLVLNMGVMLTLNQSTDFTDTDGNSITLPAGEELIYVCFMPDEYAGFRTADGEMVYAQISTSDDGRALVNGTLSDDIFDGEIYAG